MIACLRLSDLIERIKWCREHDDECRKIAAAALELGQRILTKDSLIDYFAATMWALAPAQRALTKRNSTRKKTKTKTMIKNKTKTMRSKRVLSL